jgi:Hsp70 protein
MNPRNTYVPCSFRVLVFNQCIIFSVFDVKPLIGRKFNDPMVQSDLKYLPFKVFDKGGKLYIRVKHRCERKELVCIPFIFYITYENKLE